MTPDEARRRAREIVESQKDDQVVHLNPDGTLSNSGDMPNLKKTVLHDGEGEY